MEQLRDKILVMIVGPSAIGKSTLMNEVVRQSSDFSYVRSFTTRAERPGERSHYDFISREAALKLHNDRQTVTFFEHPTTGDIYGTAAASFPTRYNLLDTLSGSVDLYRGLAFERTITISLTAPPDEWQQWFINRYPIKSPEAVKRLQEAELSVNWSLANPDTYWLENPAGKVETTAEQLINIVQDTPAHTPTPASPHAMLELIDKGMWRA